MKVSAGLILLSYLILDVSCALNNGTVISSLANSTSENLQPFIVGGVEARRNEFPWIVHLAVETKKGTAFCGGTLIEMDKVLTAAHCVVNAKGKTSIKVTAGDHNRNINEPNRQTQTSKSYKYHEKYNADDPLERPIHDIAVIKLKNAFKQTAAVRAINITSSNDTSDATRNGTGVAAGWGTLKENDNFTSHLLMKVNVTIVTNSSCSRLARDKNTQFCAGNPGKDSCQGDSGGPFICDSAPTRVCGIVSYGEGCGKADFPGVYTKVASYNEWIVKNDSLGLLPSLVGLLICVFISLI